MWRQGKLQDFSPEQNKPHVTKKTI